MYADNQPGVHILAHPECSPDVLLVPGGGTPSIDILEDQATMDFLARQGESATWIVSVCTGALLLGKAGLLKGYKAASHWAVIDTLEEVTAPNKIKKVLKGYDPIKRMVFQGRGAKVRALFDQDDMPRREQASRNRIKSNGFWMR